MKSTATIDEILRYSDKETYYKIFDLYYVLRV